MVFLVSGALCALSAVFLKGLCDSRFCLSGCVNVTNPEQFRAKVITSQLSRALKWSHRQVTFCPQILGPRPWYSQQHHLQL